MAFSRGPKIVTDGLVLYLDAANPKSYPGTGNVWNDLSGNGNDAILINSPTYNNNYFSFDGVDQLEMLDQMQTALDYQRAISFVQPFHLLFIVFFAGVLFSVDKFEKALPVIDKQYSDNLSVREILGLLFDLHRSGELELQESDGD